MEQKTNVKVSLGSKMKIVFCSLFADLIKKSNSSFIPFMILTIIELFQNCAFLVSQTFDQKNELFSSVFQISLLVSDLYYETYTFLFSLISVIITSIFILYIAFIFIITYRRFKSKIKIQIHYILILQFMLLLMEKFFSIPFILGILQINSESFALNRTVNLVLAIAKFFLIILFIIVLVIEVIFYNNEIPIGLLGW